MNKLFCRIQYNNIIVKCLKYVSRSVEYRIKVTVLWYSNRQIMLKYIVRCIDLSHCVIDTSFPVNKINFTEHSV